MKLMKWTGLGLYALGLFCMLVVLLSAGSNITRQLASFFSESKPVAAKIYGKCGNLGDCIDPDVDYSDVKRLAEGAAIYMNYCSGCHSLAHVRYERIAQDLEISTDIAEKNLKFNPGPLSQKINIGMQVNDAKQWFGAPPPDLSLITRSRNEQWLYSYLISFYRDPKTTSGYNNLVFPNVAMPHVMEQLQGERILGCKQVNRIAENGGLKRDPITNKDILFDLCDIPVMTGKYSDTALSEEDFNSKMASLTAFLSYVAEPYKNDRITIGFYVIVFLIIFTIFAWLLEQEYKKDYPKRED